MEGAAISKRWSCEVCAILGCNAASIGSQLLTFWGSLSVPSSRATQSKKVKLFLSISCRHIGGVEIHLDWFLTSPLYGVKSPALCPSHLTFSPPPTRNSPGTQWIGGLVGPSTWLDILDGRRILVPARIRTQHFPAHSTVSIPITLSQHHVMIFVVMNFQIPLHDR
jgi:hypothetical protein